jgi:hypothetical protein
MKEIMATLPCKVALGELARASEAEYQGYMHRVFSILPSYQRQKAADFFDLAMHWNEVNEQVRSALEVMNESGDPHYIANVRFLRRLIAYLTPTPEEHMAFVSGLTFGNLRIMSEICPVEIESQSVAHASASAQGCADSLVQLVEEGNVLHALAHRHPGHGVPATTPSRVDLNYMERIQSRGSEAIGIIVTRSQRGDSGYVRFFSADKPFRVVVQGNGVERQDTHVFKISI